MSEICTAEKKHDTIHVHFLRVSACEFKCLETRCDHGNDVLPTKSDILITKYPDHTPVLRFDGIGGIVMRDVKPKFRRSFLKNLL